MFNGQQIEDMGAEQMHTAQTHTEQTQLTLAADMPTANQLAELSDSELDDVSGGLSMSDLSSLFQDSGSFFKNVGFGMKKTSFAGPDGAGSSTELFFESTESGNFDRTGFGFGGN